MLLALVSHFFAFIARVRTCRLGRRLLGVDELLAEEQHVLLRVARVFYPAPTSTSVITRALGGGT